MSDRKFGWWPDLPDKNDRKLSFSWFDSKKLPKSVDLRSRMPEVWNQGEIGACTAHAVGAVVQFIQKRDKPAWDFMPSRLFMYWNTRFEEGTIHEDCGATLRNSIKSVAKFGVCTECRWPYVESDYATQPSPEAYQNAELHQALAYRRIPQNLKGIKACLASGLPIAFGFMVYDHFESDEVAISGVLPMPGKHEKARGGHAVTAVGYDDDKLAVLVRNSWGKDWGIGGHFWMPYDYITDDDLADDFWTISDLEE